ncbi:unnamed protein product [Phytomonas sp. EM1]|nr:unnamed protein product [Phytomonas sp. EM1]|eukprot:CCW62946.1 unnamed protein product [Phytomonas sp. isolate EM1]
MPEISADAADIIKLIRGLELLDEPTINLLEQLLSNRSDEGLIQYLISGKEDLITVSIFRICNNAQTPHILSYVLHFFADIVSRKPILAVQLGRADLISQFGSNPPLTFMRFVRLNSTDLSIVNPALYLAATALRYSEYEANADAFAAFFTYARIAQSSDILHLDEVQYVVRGCVLIARRKEFRRLFFKEKMVPFIPRLLTEIVSDDSGSIIQLIYETLTLAWLLSFEYEGIVCLVREKIIPQLRRVLQRVQKEKCVRMTLLILWNMAEAERKYIAHMLNPVANQWVDNQIDVLGKLNVSGKVGMGGFEPNSSLRRRVSLVSEMVSVGLLKSLSQLRRRKFGDEDVGELIQRLEGALEASMEVLTSFSEYRGEVLTGVLEWSPVHMNEKFWIDNAHKFDENDYEVIVALGKIILQTRDDTTLAVACHDLGKVVRYHPSGRTLLSLPAMEGVKERVISLMSSESTEVAKEALLCTQTIMVQRWEFTQQS